MIRQQRGARWILLVLGLLVAAWGVYRTFDWAAGLGPSLEANQFLLPLLSVALVVVVLALLAVLIRNLVRLILDRKRGLLGARLRAKLVFFFLALVLFPALVLFTGSAQVIKLSVEAILRTPLEDLTRQSGEIVTEWRRYFEGQVLRDAEELAAELVAAELLDPSRREELQQRVARWRRQHQLQFVDVRSGERLLARSMKGTEADEIAELDRRIGGLLTDVGEPPMATARIEHYSRGLLVQAAVPLRFSSDAGEEAFTVVGLLLPTRMAGNIEGFNAANQAYRQFRVQRRELVRLYLTLIALIFLVTLFVATWLGFYISRRITEPIREMADAAREISAGNLDVRVRSRTGDEVGALVDAFNEMASELEESRGVITRSTADLRRSNRALDERRRYIETLLANLSTGVLSTDRQLRVTTVNPAFQRILEVDLPLGCDPRPLLRGSGLEPLAALLDTRGGGSGIEVRRDLTLERSAGLLHVAVQVTPLEDGSEARVGILMMVEDLTELILAERAAAWREVAQRIAHEIKNPLTPIQLAAQRLRKKFRERAPDLDQVLPEATDAIEREVAALKHLVDEFSRFARMPVVSPADVDFPALVDSVLRLYAGLPAIRWELELDPDVQRVTLDPQQMRRAMINLIDNAVSALAGQGTIRIRAQAVSHHLLRIEVADSGPGIPAADRDKLFVPYFSTKKRGSGLGLAIVHRVVTDHRGTIRVEDNEPRGARFVIEIPA